MRAQLCWFGISDENIPVHITDGKCNKKGTSCRKRHLTQNACASNVSTTGTKSKHTNFAPENEKKKKNFKNFAENMAFNMESLQKMNPIKTTNLEDLNYRNKLNAK